MLAGRSAHVVQERVGPSAPVTVDQCTKATAEVALRGAKRKGLGLQRHAIANETDPRDALAKVAGMTTQLA